MERFGLAGTFKDHLVHGPGHLPLDRIAKSSIQPALEHFQ